MTAVNTGDIRIWVEANSVGNWLHESVRTQVLALCDALDEMRTERDSWQADVERLHGDLAHSMDRIAEEMAALEAERERVRVLAKALRAVEWGSAITLLGTDYSACPCCGALYRSDGSARHREPCLVATALATAGREGMGV